MRSSHVAALTLVLAAVPAAHGQSAEGAWRIETVDARGRPGGGVLWIERRGGDLSYERSTRPDLAAPVVVERGRARLVGRVLLTEEVTSAGLAGRMSGQPGAADAWRGRYTLGTDPVASGVRTLRGRSVAERLVRVDATAAGNEVRLLINGEAFDALRADLGRPRRSIDVQTFTWQDDPTGRSIADLLAARARQGTSVRALLDARSKTTSLLGGRRDFTAGLDDELRRAGADVIVQHGLLEGLRGTLANAGRAVTGVFGRLVGRAPRPRESRGFRAHDHRKLVVLDQEVGYVGGQNLTEASERDWHDVQVRVEGPAARTMAALFEDRWTAAGGRAASPRPSAPRRWTGDVPVEVLGSVPGLTDPIRARTLEAIRGARREVLFEMATVFDDETTDALQDAARRGVRVVLIMPDPAVASDKITGEAFRWVRNGVIRAGVEVYSLPGTNVHSKVGIFDGTLVTVGSHDLAGSSLAEANVFVPDPRFAREVQRRVFDVDLPRSVREPVERLSWTDRLKILGARALRSLL